MALTAENSDQGELPSLVTSTTMTRTAHGERAGDEEHDELHSAANGDAAVIHQVGAITWVAVIDGLGHGAYAKQAADVAADVVRRINDERLRVLQLLARLHGALRGTRGAAVTLARFDASGVEVGGVGNVTVRGLHGLELPHAPAGGVLGTRCDTPKSRRIPLHPGDELLLFTDGISRRAPVDDLASFGGPTLCECLLRDYSKADDDATVVHIRYLGGGSGSVDRHGLLVSQATALKQ